MKPTQPADQAVERIRLELVTRKFMVMVLALIAVWVGLTMCLTGAPSFMENWFSPWSRYLFGGASFVSGLVVSIGGVMTDLRRSGWWTQVVGLIMLTIFYLTMAGVYVGLVFSEGVLWVPPGEPLNPASTGRAYVVVVYLGLTLMTVTPLVTMLRLGRPSGD